MASVTLLTDKITDWNSFHEECASAFGFPEYYGRNMNAWIDCMSYLPDEDGMTRFQLKVDEQLLIRVPGFPEFTSRVPDVCAAFLECAALVNQRYIDTGDMPRVALVLA
jgi:hypothetical protein